MASTKQVEAAKRNVKKAQAAAKRKRTITNLPRSVRQDLARQASRRPAAPEGSRVVSWRTARASSSTSWRSVATFPDDRRWASGS